MLSNWKPFLFLIAIVFGVTALTYGLWRDLPLNTSESQPLPWIPQNSEWILRVNDIESSQNILPPLNVIAEAQDSITLYAFGNDQETNWAIAMPKFWSKERSLSIAEASFNCQINPQENGLFASAPLNKEVYYEEGALWIGTKPAIQNFEHHDASQFDQNATFNLWLKASLLSTTAADYSEDFYIDVDLSDQRITMNSIALHKPEDSWFNERIGSEYDWSNLVPPNAEHVYIEHFENHEQYLDLIRQQLNRTGELASFNDDQAQFEAKSEFVCKEVALGWSPGKMATFQWSEMPDAHFLVLEQGDSLSFGEAIVQIPGIQLLEEGEHYFLRWDESEIWNHTMLSPFAGPISCATIRDNSVVLCSDLNALQAYIRSMDRTSAEPSPKNIQTFIQGNTSAIESFKLPWLNELMKNEAWLKQFPNYRLTVHQNATNKAFLQCQLSKKEWQQNGPVLEWEYIADHQIISKVQWIKNHADGSYYAIFQDAINTVRAVSVEGEEMWSVQLQEKIIGDFHQIDLLRNNKHQILFQTKKALYCLDRLGNKVGGFPYTYPSQATSNLGVFDYDNNRKYRFVVGLENGKILNIQGEGVVTSGWKHTTKSEAITHVAHLKTGSKDYIFTADASGNTELLKRNGERRFNSEVNLPPVQVQPKFFIKSDIASSSIVYLDSAQRVIQLKFGDGGTDQLTGIGTANWQNVLDVDGDLVDDLVLIRDKELEVFNSARNLLLQVDFPDKLLPEIRKYQFSNGVALGVLLEGSKEIQFIQLDGQKHPYSGLYGKQLPSIRDADGDGKMEGLTTDGFRAIYCYEF